MVSLWSFLPLLKNCTHRPPNPETDSWGLSDMRTQREDSQCDRARGSARDDTSAWGRFRPGARWGLPSSQWAVCARGSARLQRRRPCTLSLSLPVAQAWSAVSVCISTGELMRVRLPWTLQKAHFTSHVPMSVSVDQLLFTLDVRRV